MNKKTILVLLVSLQSCTSVATENYSCPEKILAQTNVEEISNEWTAQAGNSNHYLVSAGFSDGNPLEKFILSPSQVIESPSSNEGDAAIYDLSSIDSPWLICNYGNTPATLLKPLEKQYSKCKVTLPKDASELIITCE